MIEAIETEMKITEQIQCITAMTEYENSSLEELRLECYEARSKGEQHSATALNLRSAEFNHDLAGFNIGKINPLNEEKLNEAFALQNLIDGGYWELNEKLGRILGFDADACYTVLVSAGLKSFGAQAATEICRLLATLLVLLSIEKNYEIFLSLRKQPSGLKQCLHSMQDNPHPRHSHCETLASTYALDYLSKYSLVCSSLGLARSWELFIEQLIASQ